jgi:hypothetical protein
MILMGHEGALAIMAVSFFAAIGVTVRTIAEIWTKRIDSRRKSVPSGALGEQLNRIESAVEAIALEVERISEAQRFQARLQAESARPSLPARAPESRVITPH